MAEKIEMSQGAPGIDEIYNESSKYITFDEHGNPTEDGKNTNLQDNRLAVEYRVPTDSLKKPDNHKYVKIVEDFMVAHNITASGVPYAIPNKSNAIKAEVEDNEKYERRDNVEKVVSGNAVPNESGANAKVDEEDK